jgi:hypothetical protein
MKGMWTSKVSSSLKLKRFKVTVNKNQWRKKAFKERKYVMWVSKVQSCAVGFTKRKS